MKLPGEFSVQARCYVFRKILLLESIYNKKTMQKLPRSFIGSKQILKCILFFKLCNNVIISSSIFSFDIKNVFFKINHIDSIAINYSYYYYSIWCYCINFISYFRIFNQNYCIIIYTVYFSFTYPYICPCMHP